MTSKTPEELMKRIAIAVQSHDISAVKEFLEEFTIEILEAQKPQYEKLLISAAEQGIISERARCIEVVTNALPDSETKTSLIAAIRGEPQPS
jgi:hypothetical protein